MKRKPTSKIYHTALYLHRVCGRTTFTARDIHDAMPAARDHYHSLIPARVLAERDRLLVEYHCVFDYDQSRCYLVYGRSTGSYDELVELNVMLRRLFKPYITIDEQYYCSNLTADQVSNTFKRGYIELVATTPYRTYRINPDYLTD